MPGEAAHGQVLKTLRIYILWGFVAALLLLLLWKPWGQPGPSSNPWIAEFGRLKADLTLEGVRYQRHVRNKQLWSLRSDRARLFEGRDIMEFEGVDITFYPTGGGRVQVTADSGTYFISKDSLRVYGHVVVHSQDGFVLRTTSLNYSQAKMSIWTRDRVTIENVNGLALNGQGMRYDLKSGRLSVGRQSSVLPQDEIEL